MEMIIPLEDLSNTSLLFGSYNCNIKLLRKAFDVNIIARDRITIQGDAESVEKAGKAVNTLKEHILQKKDLTSEQAENIIAKFAQQRGVEQTADNFPVKSRKQRQEDYMKAIRDCEIVFGIGPAGTGKTYLAVAMAVDALREGTAHRIVLVRPAVEAGEKLGFLPGDYQAKINPYLRPLYDALYELLPYERLKKYMQKGIVEIAPLAYMRGRTLESAFVILDEAQNSTITQMKMFLTRLGFHSKMVVTGDITQVDLPNQSDSGLIHAKNMLTNIEGVSFFYFHPEDIVRHPLVQKIVEAYEKDLV